MLHIVRFRRSMLKTAYYTRAAMAQQSDSLLTGLRAVSVCVCVHADYTCVSVSL